MLRKYFVCVCGGGGGGLDGPDNLIKLLFLPKIILFTASPHKGFEIAILQDKIHYIQKYIFFHILAKTTTFPGQTPIFQF